MLKNFNPYINRICKKFTLLNQYLDYQVGDTLTNIAFDFTSEVGGSLTVNYDYDAEGRPDYVICTKSGSTTIHSRWYVVGVERIRLGQFQLTLYRDTCADFRDDIMNAKSMIARGTVAQSDPFIYNSENSRLNVIKKGELLLKDYTQCPWLIGYISQDVAYDAGTVEIKTYEQSVYQFENITEYPYYQYRNSVTTNGKGFLSVSYQRYSGSSGGNGVFPGTFDLNLSNTEIPGHDRLLYYSPSQKVLHSNIELESAYLQTVKNKWDSQVSPDTKAEIANSNPQQQVTSQEFNEIVEQQNKVIKTRYGNYKFKIVNDGYTIGQYISPRFVSVINGLLSEPDWTGPLVKENINYINYSFHLEFEQVPVDSRVDYKIEFSGKDLSNKTSPYGIICMPYEDGYKTLSDVTDELQGVAMTKDERLKIMQGLGAIDNLIYDLQIFPYCPISTMTKNTQSHVYYNVPMVRTIRVYAGDGTFKTNIYAVDNGEFSLFVGDEIPAKDIKTANECDIYRLVSPNYASNFEFNPCKFGIHTSPVAGEPAWFMKRFTVDVRLKPFQPYLHVAPQWDGLYGEEYHDAKGLICGGDFSVDRVSDQWATYQYNNKNFQLQFDRQIETMEFNKKMGWLGAGMAAAGAATGIGSSLHLGEWAGAALSPGKDNDSKWAHMMAQGSGPIKFNALMAGTAGTAPIMAGQVAKSAAITAGAIAMGIANHARINEQIAARTDDFNWTNENIDARPYGLTKVTVLNRNFKYFPFLEYYSCTQEEEDQLHERLTLQGMTVNKIGCIKDYLNKNTDGTYKYPIAGGWYNKNYIRATIIKFPENSDSKVDDEVLMTINNELAEGVYFDEVI